MRRRRYSLNSNDGFTLVEIFVASFISLLVLSLTLSTIITNKRVFQLDVARTSLNQNIRAVMDILGANVREAGENLGSGFPAVEVINGTGDASDQLILRRNLLDEVLKVCQEIEADGTDTEIYFATAGTEAGCSYSDNQNNYTAWQAFRVAEGGDSTAFIFNFNTKQGEFLSYLSEGDTGSSYYLETSAGTWQYAYTVGPSALYLIEEWHFKMDNDVLQLVVNGDEANPLNIADQLESFQVTVIMQDDSEKTSFGRSDSWSSIKGIEIAIRGATSFDGEDVVAEQSMRFYPRNVLSN